MFNLFNIVLSSQISSAIPHHHIASYRLIPYDIMPHHIVPYHTIKHNIIIICKKTFHKVVRWNMGYHQNQKKCFVIFMMISSESNGRKMHSYLGALFFKFLSIPPIYFSKPTPTAGIQKIWGFLLKDTAFLSSTAGNQPSQAKRKYTP